jgi:preprotein translocase SecE subunit
MGAPLKRAVALTARAAVSKTAGWGFESLLPCRVGFLKFLVRVPGGPVEKYVRIAFVVGGLLVYVILASFFSWFFQLVAPNLDYPILGNDFFVSNVIALVAAMGGVIYVWFNPRITKFAMEVAAELRNVTWPNWPETRVGTIVVVVATIVISLILGFFDLVWGWLSTLVYRL